MSDMISPLLEWLNANPEWASFATFMISAGESVAIIGTIVPGSITMTAIGALAGAGIIPLWETLFWATIGAIVGDGISYWIGYYFKERLHNIWPFNKNPAILQKGEAFVHKYGVMSVFIGRFVGPVRALVPLVAGMFGMKPLQFTIANVASAIGWAPAYMLPGILLGAASLELPPDIAMHVILVLLMIILLTLLCLWFIYKSLQLIGLHTEKTLNTIWETLKQSRYFNIATVLLKHHNPQKQHGQLTLAFYFIVTTLLFLALAFYVKSVGAAFIPLNDVIFHLFRGVRNETVDHIMICITLLGQKQIILPVILTSFLWLFFTQHRRAAWHILTLGIFATGSVYLIKHGIQSSRPFGIMNHAETFSMPSGHTTLATTVYLGLLLIIGNTLPHPKWRLIYASGIFIAFLVGLSRLYLGAHWFTDIIGAWLLSASILIFILLSFKRQRENSIPLLGIAIVSLSTLCLTYSFYYYQHFTELQFNHTQRDWPVKQITLDQWWKKHEVIANPRVSLFGFRSQYINIQWVGDLKTIKTTLLNEGWSRPPARDWISTLHRISDIKSNQFLPLISPQYLDKRPALILTKRLNGKKRLLVVRLWESNINIEKTNTPIWVGTIGLIPRSYSWLLRKNQEIAVDPQLLLHSPSAKKQWEYQTIILNHNQQKILFIKEKNRKYS